MFQQCRRISPFFLHSHWSVVDRSLPPYLISSGLPVFAPQPKYTTRDCRKNRKIYEKREQRFWIQLFLLFLSLTILFFFRRCVYDFTLSFNFQRLPFPLLSDGTRGYTCTVGSREYRCSPHCEKAGQLASYILPQVNYFTSFTIPATVRFVFYTRTRRRLVYYGFFGCSPPPTSSPRPSPQD